jgi:hypothetical protein
MVSNCLVCCLLCLALHYTCDIDSYVGLIETEVMLCLFEIEQAWLWAGEQLPCGLLVLPDMLPLCRLVCLPLPK